MTVLNVQTSAEFLHQCSIIIDVTETLYRFLKTHRSWYFDLSAQEEVL